jgi:hypothetical protein
MNISEPYKKVISIEFLGRVCEGKPGYQLPEKDVYLIYLREYFIKYIQKNYWHGRKIQGYDIIKTEIAGYGSSGYENHFSILIGFWKNTSDSTINKFIKMVGGYKNFLY